MTSLTSVTFVRLIWIERLRFRLSLLISLLRKVREKKTNIISLNFALFILSVFLIATYSIYRCPCRISQINEKNTVSKCQISRLLK